MSNQQLSDDYQRWIDDLLTSPAARPSAPESLRNALNRERSRNRRWSAVRRVMAVAALLGAVAFWPRTEDVGVDHALPRAVAPLNTPDASTPAIVKFIPNRNSVTVSHPSPAPTVTVVEFFPTTSAQERWRRRSIVRSLRNRLRQGADAS